jgi:hypothetical protein
MLLRRRAAAATSTVACPSGAGALAEKSWLQKKAKQSTARLWRRRRWRRAHLDGGAVGRRARECDQQGDEGEGGHGVFGCAVCSGAVRGCSARGVFGCSQAVQ